MICDARYAALMKCRQPCEASRNSSLNSNLIHATSRWTEADSPWQLLAVCMDIAGALRSGDPRNYLSRMPVHQDGSCNGLQHYAALGRDVWGGSAVNLTPTEGHQVSRQRLANIHFDRAIL